ncbi:hypothetical protein AEGHOMDF_1900 [Methylobacterium soli]|nr:hypothetical protein AEGHOMDF_1900 [Methylobacterium soli]
MEVRKQGLGLSQPALSFGDTPVIAGQSLHKLDLLCMTRLSLSNKALHGLQVAFRHLAQNPLLAAATA